MAGRNILLFGRNGQLSWELVRCLSPLGNLVALGRENVDLSSVSAEELRQLIRSLKPGLVVNAAAYTHVDRAEGDQEAALQVNGVAPALMAAECERLGTPLVHFSTDYVFDGTKGEPYDEQDSPAPINVYGRTKLVGENEIQDRCRRFVILRTSWLYSFRAQSFPTKVLEWARKQQVMQVVADQIGSPTWARMLAQATAFMLGQASTEPPDWFVEKSGIYHVAGSGQTSRFDWARKIVSLDPAAAEQSVKDITPVSSSVFPTAAERPADSSLNCGRFERTFGLSLPPWDQALEMAMERSYGWD